VFLIPNLLKYCQLHTIAGTFFYGTKVLELCKRRLDGIGNFLGLDGFYYFICFEVVCPT
jgi:hypothetical protein